MSYGTLGPPLLRDGLSYRHSLPSPQTRRKGRSRHVTPSAVPARIMIWGHPRHRGSASSCVEGRRRFGAGTLRVPAPQQRRRPEPGTQVARKVAGRSPEHMAQIRPRKAPGRRDPSLGLPLQAQEGSGEGPRVDLCGLCRGGRPLQGPLPAAPGAPPWPAAGLRDPIPFPVPKTLSLPLPDL